MMAHEGRRKVVIGYVATPSSSCPSSCCDAVGFVLLLAPTAVPKASERKRWTPNAKGGRTSKRAATPLVDSVLVALVAAMLLHAVQRGSYWAAS